MIRSAICVASLALLATLAVVPAAQAAEGDEVIESAYDEFGCFKARGNVAVEDYKEVLRNNCAPELEGLAVMGRAFDTVPIDNTSCDTALVPVDVLGMVAAFEFRGFHESCRLNGIETEFLDIDQDEMRFDFFVNGVLAPRLADEPYIIEVPAVQCTDIEPPASFASGNIITVQVWNTTTDEYVTASNIVGGAAVIVDAECQPFLVGGLEQDEVFTPYINQCRGYVVPPESISTTGTKLRFDLYWNTGCGRTVFSSFGPEYAVLDPDGAANKGVHRPELWNLLRQDAENHARLEVELGEYCEGPILALGQFDTPLISMIWFQPFATPAVGGGCEYDRFEQMQNEIYLNYGIAPEPPSPFEQLAARPDLTGDHANILRLYWAAFDREPDAGGAEWWIDAFNGGSWPTLTRIAEHFVVSKEFIDTYGELDNAAFVEALYSNILDRPSDAGGRAFWLDDLNDGTRTRGQVLADFSFSQEFRDSHPLPSDNR